jgi:hypothetical protein
MYVVSDAHHDACLYIIVMRLERGVGVVCFV